MRLICISMLVLLSSSSSSFLLPSSSSSFVLLCLLFLLLLLLLLLLLAETEPRYYSSISKHIALAWLGFVRCKHDLDASAPSFESIHL